MTQQEIYISLYNQMAAAAAGIWETKEGFKMSVGEYTAADIEKTFKFADNYKGYRASDIAKLSDELTTATEQFNAVNNAEHIDAVKLMQQLAANRSRAKIYDEHRTLSGEWHAKHNAMQAAAAKYNEAQIFHNTVDGLTDILTFSIDSFSCSMAAAVLFAKMAQWEKEFKISPAKRAKFIREEEEKDITLSCNIQFPKEIKHIADYVSTEFGRPILQGVLIDCENSCMVASDTYILTEIPIKISDVKGDQSQVTIPAKIAKQLSGTSCTMKIYESGKKVKFIPESGTPIIAETIKGNFPVYRRVMPKVNRSGNFRVSKNGIKTLASWLKTIIKQTGDNQNGGTVVKLEFPAHSQEGTATFFDSCTRIYNTIKIPVIDTPEINICVGVNAFKLSKVIKNWDGSAWFVSNSRPLVFDSPNTTCTLIMPMICYNYDFKSDSCPGVVDAIKRHDYDAALSETDQPKETGKEKSQPITRAEKETAALRYCEVKGVKCDIITDSDEIRTISGRKRIIFKGYFRRISDTDNLVIFECTGKEDDEPETDYNDFSNALADILECLTQTMSAISNHLLIKISCSCLDLFNQFGAIIAMINKFSEFQTAAETACIDVNFSTADNYSTQQDKTASEPPDPPQAEESEVTTDLPEPEFNVESTPEPPPPDEPVSYEPPPGLSPPFIILFPQSSTQHVKQTIRAP